MSSNDYGPSSQSYQPSSRTTVCRQKSSIVAPKNSRYVLTPLIQEMLIPSPPPSQTQAIHTQTGFTLRRFNVDISQGTSPSYALGNVADRECVEEFESELERLNVSLVGENQGLQQENRQLSVLLKDYEGTLEAVMAKFRAYGVSLPSLHPATPTDAWWVVVLDAAASSRSHSTL